MSSVISQWLVGPFMVTKQRIRSHIVAINDPVSDYEMRLTLVANAMSGFEKTFLKDHKL